MDLVDIMMAKARLQGEISDHVNNTEIHVSEEDGQLLRNISPGALKFSTASLASLLDYYMAEENRINE